jgi:hypothetical protein
MVDMKKRLAMLRDYRWSSYPFYAGYKRRVPEWLDVSVVGKMAGSVASYRRMAEARISGGFDGGFVARLTDRLALGGEAFVARMRGMCELDSEYEDERILRHRYSWETIVAATERVRGSRWAEFSSVRGDWGRATVYYLARRYGGLTLAEIGEAAGGVKYSAVSKMMKRFEERIRSDADLKGVLLEPQ